MADSKPTLILLPKILPDPLRMSVSVETVADISRNRIGPVVMDSHNQHYAYWQLRGDHTVLCIDGKTYELGDPARIKNKDKDGWMTRSQSVHESDELTFRAQNNALFAPECSSTGEIHPPVFSDDGARVAVITMSGMAVNDADFRCHIFQKDGQIWSKIDYFMMGNSDSDERYGKKNQSICFAAASSLNKWAWVERQVVGRTFINPNSVSVWGKWVQVRDITTKKTERLQSDDGVKYSEVSHLGYNRTNFALGFIEDLEDFSGKIWWVGCDAEGPFFTGSPWFVFKGNNLLAKEVNPLLPPARIPGSNEYAFVKQRPDQSSSWVETKSASSDRFNNVSRFFDKNRDAVFFTVQDGKLVRVGQIDSKGIQMHQTEFDRVEEIASSSDAEDYYIGENGSGGHDGKWLYKFPTKAITRWPLFSDTNNNFDSQDPLPKELASIKLMQPDQSHLVVAFAPDGEKCIVKRDKNLALVANLPEEFRTLPTLPKDEQFEKSSSVIEHNGLYFLSDERTPIPEGGKVVSSPWEYLAEFKRCYDANNYTRKTEVNLKKVDGLRPNEELVPLDRTDEINDVTWTSNESFSFMAMAQNRLLRCHVRVTRN
jgi:hypothetical protein